MSVPWALRLCDMHFAQFISYFIDQTISLKVVREHSMIKITVTCCSSAVTVRQRKAINDYKRESGNRECFAFMVGKNKRFRIYSNE